MKKEGTDRKTGDGVKKESAEDGKNDKIASSGLAFFKKVKSEDSQCSISGGSDESPDSEGASEGVIRDDAQKSEQKTGASSVSFGERHLYGENRFDVGRTKRKKSNEKTSNEADHKPKPIFFGCVHINNTIIVEPHSLATKKSLH